MPGGKDGERQQSHWARPSHAGGLDRERVHEFWRMQLLDDLHRKLQAIDYEPSLDRSGGRRAAILALIEEFERIEVGELRAHHG